MTKRSNISRRSTEDGKAEIISHDDACPSCGGSGRYGDAAVRAFDRPASSHGVEVKGLEWGETSYGTPEAITVIGVYRISQNIVGGWSVVTSHRALETEDGRLNFPSLGQAKAAAQADYEHRILSALLPTPAVEAEGVTDAARDVLAERRRQVDGEGWTPDHDNEHSHGQLAGAAACYAIAEVPHWFSETAVEHLWPWENIWWKPSLGNPRRNLVKAGALILAEIERLDRAALTAALSTGDGREGE